MFRKVMLALAVGFGLLGAAGTASADYKTTNSFSQKKLDVYGSPRCDSHHLAQLVGLFAGAGSLSLYHATTAWLHRPEHMPHRRAGDNEPIEVGNARVLD